MAEKVSWIVDYDRNLGGGRVLTAKQPMSNIGDGFAGRYAYLSWLYTIKMVPAEAYDAIIFVREATPTTMLEG